MNLNKDMFKDVYDAATAVAAKHPTSNILELSELMLYVAIWIAKRFALGEKEQLLATEHLDQYWQNMLMLEIPLYVNETKKNGKT